MRQAEQQEEIGSISTGRLPSGRHGLPREAVVRAQRDRLIESMIAVVAEIGYTEATVADVIRGGRGLTGHLLRAVHRQGGLLRSRLQLGDGRHVRAGFRGSRLGRIFRLGGSDPGRDRRPARVPGREPALGQDRDRRGVRSRAPGPGSLPAGGRRFFSRSSMPDARWPISRTGYRARSPG